MLNGIQIKVNEFRGRKRYNFAFPVMKQSVPIRINVLRPMKGVSMKVQKGRDELVPPVSSSDELLTFEFLIDVEIQDGAPNFLGKFAQGPRHARFIYVNSGSYAGQPWTQWNRRAKISLMSITSEQVNHVIGDEVLCLETEFEGIGRDGGPTCASVKDIVWKVVAR